jgi:prephenate dehydrogenase
MKIFIVGLGLIGASYAAKLSEKHEVYGYDKELKTIEKARSQKLILGSDLNHMKDSDVVILALYPAAITTFLKSNINRFNPNQLITDVSGTKEKLLNEIDSFLPSNLTYLSHHPMAGREKGGFDQHHKDLFKEASAIIINEDASKSAVDRLKNILKDLAFKTIVETDRLTHDARIAFTSQLPHALAIALMHMAKGNDILSFSGNSFKDLTRIASINKRLWSSLFLENNQALTHEIDAMIENLETIKTLLSHYDQEGLMAYMATAKERRDHYEEDSN